MKTILFHGPPGCGKDTQIDLLKEVHDFERIGTGDMFRAMFNEGTDLGIEAHDDMMKGFVPSELTYRMLNEWVRRFDMEKDWYLVSIVRSEDQIPMFDRLMEDAGRELDLFVHFSLTEAAAVERISLRSTCPKCFTTYHDKYKPEKVKGKCDKEGCELFKRDDDRPDVVAFRQRQYQESIKPILDTFRSRGKLVEIDASPSIEEISKVLKKTLYG